MPHFNESLKYLVERDGTSQNQRIAKALDPSFAKLDERKLEDFLVFAIEFSKKVKFFDLNNNAAGSWEGFWTSDPTMVIAAITKSNPLPAKASFENIASQTHSPKGLENAVKNVLEIAKKIDYWFKNIRTGTSLYTEIRRLIMANFKDFLLELATLETSAAAYIDGYKGYNEGNYLNFSKEWGFDIKETIPSSNINLLTPVSPIGEENPMRCEKSLTQEQKLGAAYSLLNELFTKVYNIYFQIIQQSSHHLQDSLSRKDHPPHIALFIGFLKLYLQVQEHLNQMTKKHLDFFYRDVLELKPKDAVPDKAHVFFELAKNRLEHSLEGGVRFRADKDVEGNDLIYALDKTSVFNIASVESLKTLYLKSDETNSNTNGLKAAPIANSEDGLGTPIQDAEIPTWYTMGSSNMPDGQIGFALASPELLLTEGTRTVTVTVETSVDVPVVNENTFQVYLSGEGEWISANFSANKLEGDSNKITIICNLEPDIPPVLPFNAEEFEEELGTDLPVIKILINPEKLKNPPTNQDFLNLKFDKITLDIEVKGFTQIMAFNDEGKLDAGKPFLPFTSIPKKGSSFFIGSKEAFRKKLSELKVKVTWEVHPTNFLEYNAGYENIREEFNINVFLIGGNEPTPLSIDVSDIESEHATLLKTKDDELIIRQADNGKIAEILSSEKAENYGISDKYGFLRIDLLDDFGHNQYQQVLTRQMLAVAMYPNVVNGAYYWESGNGRSAVKLTATETTTQEVVIPNPPYTPTIKRITIDYKSKSSTDKNNEDGHIQFIHLHPFKNTYERINDINKSHLLPQFENPKSKTKTNELINQAGALLIGLNNLQPRQSLSLLFQLVENSANAGLPKPDVHWYYLMSNQWKPFKESDVLSDTTDGLLTAGIVELAIPHDINKKNTILPSDLHWLKATVSESPEAISQAIAVHAQAAQITFQDNENDLSHLKQPLPAETISKLENEDSAVKGVSQLYDSFGGRPVESDQSFYTRISEHLRHKGRAITLFDYERLVLEAFPSIYKVRCVNHTNLTDDDTFHLNPGHVIISVVPDFSKLKAVDKMEPKVSLAQLEKIKRFLEDRNCAFVGTSSEDNPEKQPSLHVLNPKYEKIKVNFKVRFTREIAAIEFHIEQLKNALVRFMSPWAFDDAAEITFGGKVFKSVLLHFVEKQPYVDYVKDFHMMHEDTTEDTNIIASQTPISILVPSTEDGIGIDYIYDETCVSESRQNTIGLGYQNLENTEIKP